MSSFLDTNTLFHSAELLALLRLSGVRQISVVDAVILLQLLQCHQLSALSISGTCATTQYHGEAASVLRRFIRSSFIVTSYAFSIWFWFHGIFLLEKIGCTYTFFTKVGALGRFRIYKGIEASYLLFWASISVAAAFCILLGLIFSACVRLIITLHRVDRGKLPRSRSSSAREDNS